MKYKTADKKWVAARDKHVAAAKRFEKLDLQKRRAEAEAARKIEKRFGARVRAAAALARRTKAAFDKATDDVMRIIKAEGRDMDGTLVPGKRKR